MSVKEYRGMAGIARVKQLFRSSTDRTTTASWLLTLERHCYKKNMWLQIALLFRARQTNAKLDYENSATVKY